MAMLGCWEMDSSHILHLKCHAQLAKVLSWQEEVLCPRKTKSRPWRSNQHLNISYSNCLMEYSKPQQFSLDSNPPKISGHGLVDVL